MNTSFLAAAVLLALVGAVHSLFGERWIFRRMRVSGGIPTNGGSVLREPHVRILWVTWHLATILGLALAGMLGWMAMAANSGMLRSPLPALICGASAAGGLLVFVGTRGKHLGWAGLLGVALLTGAGMRL